ncbi:Phenylalanyl-tRNA synthetase, beta subunit, cytoplasmic, partial [Elasticomyces elasticus]
MPGTRGPVPVPLGDLTQQILDKLETTAPFNTDSGLDASQSEVKAALDRLASRSMVAYETKDTEQVLLTDEGQTICDQGSHEFKVWDAVTRKGKIAVKDLAAAVGAESAKVGQGKAFQAKWIKKDGDSLVPIAADVQDTTRSVLQEAQSTKAIKDSKVLADFKKRKLVKTEKIISYRVDKGLKYAKEIPVEYTDLTVDMVNDGSWETANFKPYNFRALGAPQDGGALHPLNKVREEFRKIFLFQGFTEMPTGRFVDSGFWNFDALFVPQQHPARDLQDTFYVADPPEADLPRMDLVADRALAEMEAASKQEELSDAETDPSIESKRVNYAQYYENVKAVHQNG